MKSVLYSSFLVFIVLSSVTRAQQTIAISDKGWRLWLDREAGWADDSIFLPEEVDLSKLPVNAPTGGWEVLNSSNGIPVTLPSTVEEHFWGVSGLRKYKDEYVYEDQDSVIKNGNYLGVSWWWCDVDVPKSFQNKNVILLIRGSRLRAEVYWEKKLVGYNIVNEVSFTCDVSNAIRPGRKNRLAIRITNPGGRLDWVDTQLMSWGKTGQKFHRSHGFGGLDRGITLNAHDPVYLSDFWALNTPRQFQISANAKVTNRASHTVTGAIRFEVYDPQNANTVCAATDRKIALNASAESTVHAELEYPKAVLWSPEHPRLYSLRAKLVCDSRKETPSKVKQCIDTREQLFGFRWFEPTGVGKNAMLRLNGKRVRLVSAISWGFWGFNGLWPTPELAEREVRAAKELGMNCIQFHRNVGKKEVLDVQDRLGLMRYMEPGGGQTSFGEDFSLYAPSPKERIDDSGTDGEPRTFSEKYMEDKIVRMIRDHRSHPSLMLWCVQNEIHPDLKNPRIFHLLRRMRQEDPSRTIVLKSGFPSGKPSVNQAWLEPYSEVVHYDTGDGYSGWWDDHTVGGPGVWRDEMYMNPEDFTHRSTNDGEIVMWGEMLGAAVPDNHARMVRELQAHGGKSYDIADHKAILAAYNNFLDKWEFRKTFPTAEALFTAIGNKSYDFWGLVVQTARLAEANDYFVMSGWESTAIENHSGLVDNLRGFKGDPALIRKRLAPLVPVIETKSAVLAKGDNALLDLYLLNETHKPHGDKLRVWCTSSSGKKTHMGTFDIPPYKEDQFVYPVKMKVPTPRFSVEGNVTVRAEVVGAANVAGDREILIVDPKGTGKIARRIGILSSQPSFQHSFELFPDVLVEPYQSDRGYDVVIAADRLIRPFDAQVESTRTIQGTEDQQLYRSIHYGTQGNFDYFFRNLPKGEARVTLKFVELFQNAPGVRVFDVAINGDTVLKDFDVYKAAGGMNIACDRTFTVPTPDGVVEITVPEVKAGSARIAGIKIEAGDSVIAVKCGGESYKDKKGLTWNPYEPAVQLDEELLKKVKGGLPLVVLSEGGIAASQFAERLGKAGAFEYEGHVGEARASWMGSWYFVRKHPLYDGLPVNCAMNSFYQVPVDNADGVLLNGKNVEVVAGYSRDHDRSIGAGSFVAKLGNGRVVFHCIPGVVGGLNGRSSGMHPLLVKRLIANSLRYATGGASEVNASHDKP